MLGFPPPPPFNGKLHLHDAAKRWRAAGRFDSSPKPRQTFHLHCTLRCAKATCLFGLNQECNGLDVICLNHCTVGLCMAHIVPVVAVHPALLMRMIVFKFLLSCSCFSLIVYNGEKCP